MANNGSWIQTDFILPSQIDTGPRYRSGEQALLAAVVEDAIDTLEKAVGSRNPPELQLYAETREWFERPTTGAVSLAFACHHLGLDLDAARAAVLRRFPAPMVPRTVPVDTSAPPCSVGAF